MKFRFFLELKEEKIYDIGGPEFESLEDCIEECIEYNEKVSSTLCFPKELDPVYIMCVLYTDKDMQYIGTYEFKNERAAKEFAETRNLFPKPVIMEKVEE